MRGLALTLGCLALLGCADQPAKKGGLKIPPELEPLNDLVFSCWIDTEVVPLQHSEHCVIVAETILEDDRPDCFRSNSEECVELELAQHSIYSGYQAAIIQSAVNFGIPEAVSDAAKDRIAHTVYFDGALIRGLFEECLRMEQEALAKKGLQRIHSIMVHPLAEDQMCIREGNGRFETEPL
ncbi:MAG: hypothetical protein AAFQ34_07160 [Pseudomonadota bacterium]